MNSVPICDAHEQPEAEGTDWMIDMSDHLTDRGIAFLPTISANDIEGDMRQMTIVDLSQCLMTPIGPQVQLRFAALWGGDFGWYVVTNLKQSFIDEIRGLLSEAYLESYSQAVRETLAVPPTRH